MSAQLGQAVAVCKGPVPPSQSSLLDSEKTGRLCPSGQGTVASWNCPGSEAQPEYGDSYKLTGHSNTSQTLRTLDQIVNLC